MSQAYENEEIVVIMDQAGWHKAKDLVVPDNIDIIYLPPYSPELNPIERLWKYMKTNYIHNRVFESLKQMMALMVDVFAGLKPVIPTQLIFYPKLLVTKIQSA